MAQAPLATFSYVSSAYQTWTVPAGSSLVKIVAAGAQGSAPSSSSYPGGLGAEVSGLFTVTPGHVLWIYVPSQPWIGGGDGFSSNADGGGAAVVMDATSGELLVVAAGGGGSDGTAPGGVGGQVGGAGGGTLPGGGALGNGAGTGGAAGGGPMVGSTSGLSWTAAGGASSGGGGGYYSGNGGGATATSSSREPDGTYSVATSGEQSSGSYSGGSGISSTTVTTSGSSSPSSTGGAPWDYYVINNCEFHYNVTTYNAGPPNYNYSDIGSSTASYSSYQGSGWTTSPQSYTGVGGETGYMYYVYSFTGSTYTQSDYETTYTENYSTVESTYVSETGSGGGGSSYVIPGTGLVSYTDGAQAGNGSVLIYPPAVAPTVTLASPSDGSYVDLSGTPTFVANYVDVDESTCAAWQFSWTPQGAATTYWDASTESFTATATWNPGGSSVTFPPGTFSNGYTATWSMNLQSSYGPAYTSGFAAGFQVTGQDAPVAAITYPVASTLSSIMTLSLSAVAPSGLSITSWRLVVYPEDVVSASGFEWGGPSPSLDTGAVSGPPPATYSPVSLSLGVPYIAGLLVTETYGESSEWASSGPFELYSVLATSGGVVGTGSLGMFSGIHWAPGYLTSSGSLLPATVTSSVIRSFSNVNAVAFATQQSDPVQLVADDTFSSPHLLTWPFPQVSDPDYASINDFKTLGDVRASVGGTSPGVLVVQGVNADAASLDESISVLPTPVLAEGQLLTSQSTPSGLVSPSFVPSGAGELYIAVRFVPLTSLVAVLQLWDASNSEVLSEWSIPAGASQAVQTWRSYTIGSLVPPSTPLQVALLVEGSGNRWLMQAMSAFDEGVVWEFTADGVNWVDATQVRNRRYGSVMFPVPGRELQWRATFYQSDRTVSHLRIRPHYPNRRSAGGPPLRSGPTVSAADPLADISTDPFFASSLSPIPLSWFAPGTIGAGGMGS